jgi:Putative Actinobacterial Holin-X, holin superfamily III
MTAGTPGNSTSDLLQSLGADLAALLRRELQQAQRELLDKTREAGTAAGMLGGAGVLGAMAAGSSVALLMRLLDRRLSTTASAALTTALLGGGAAALAAAGLIRLREAMPLIPEDAVASLRHDVRVATDTSTPETPPRP